MIDEAHGNLLEADVDALVNTVNTVGVMGKGVALQFRQAFPANYAAYRQAVARGDVEPGRMFVFATGLLQPRYIINFPTKRHWRGRSRMDDIESGLADLRKVVRELEVTSLAVPPLGCGNGGLRWSDVRPRIVAALSDVPARVLLFAPEGAPIPDTMPIATAKPHMTFNRAALLGILARYAEPGYRLTLLEVQKLAYLLQVAGQPSALSFKKARYGPYAEQLEHVLQGLEGHYIRGYGDRSRETTIVVLPEARHEAVAALNQEPESEARFWRVGELIDGFESPYGLELLATVHWVCADDPAATTDRARAVAHVQNWNERKRRTFPASHIQTAWHHLKSYEWI